MRHPLEGKQNENGRLPLDFRCERYGLQVRLVNESDAQFILNLRLDPIKSKYLGYTEPDIEHQINWIRRYKEREAEGTDYYFIYFYKGSRAGVNRLYKIQDDHFIHGSWLFSNDVPPYCPLAAAVIARQIAFFDLNLTIEVDTDGIHVDNTGVIQFASFMGEKFTGIRTTDMGDFKTGYLTKEKFIEKLPSLLRLFPKQVQ